MSEKKSKFVSEYCSRCLHRHVCKYREKLESVPALREIQEIIGSCKFFVEMPKPARPKPVVTVEKPKVDYEEMKGKVIHWVASQPYGTKFTVKSLREELELPTWRGVSVILRTLEKQGWIRRGEKVKREGVPAYEYFVTLHRKPTREEIERVRKAELV